MDKLPIHCPKCLTLEELKTATRQNVEIDYCPKCNGIWLDSGELKKIISHYLEKANENNIELDKLRERAEAKTSVPNLYQTSNSSSSGRLSNLLDIVEIFI